MFRRSVRTSLTVIGALLLLAIVAITCWALYRAAARLLAVGTQAVPEAVDAGWLREEFSLPPEVDLVSLWRSDDTPGWYGREGLRMVGEYNFTLEQLADFHASAADLGWHPEPLPELAASFPEPPVELPDFVEGLSYCTITYFGAWEGDEWRSGGSMDAAVELPCRDYPEARVIYGDSFDHYRAGVLDTLLGQVWVVLKNCY